MIQTERDAFSAFGAEDEIVSQSSIRPGDDSDINTPGVSVQAFLESRNPVFALEMIQTKSWDFNEPARTAVAIQYSPWR